MRENMREVWTRVASFAALLVALTFWAGLTVGQQATTAQTRVTQTRVELTGSHPAQTREAIGIRWAFHHLRACPQEDSRNCAWDARTMGNGIGHSFVDLNGHAYYLRPADQRRWGYHYTAAQTFVREMLRKGWHRFHAVEGHRPCVIIRENTSVVACADGFSTTS